MKRNLSVVEGSVKREKHSQDTPTPDPLFLSSVTCYILPACFGLKRLEIFKKQIEKYGGKLQSSLNEKGNLTYIIVEDSIDQAKIEKLINLSGLGSTIIVKSSWLSDCLKSKSLVEESGHVLYKQPNNTLDNLRSSVKVDSDDLATTACTSTADATSNLTEGTVHLSAKQSFAELKPSEALPTKFQSKFACAHSSASHQESIAGSPNAYITEELKKLLQVYQAKNDTWRIAGYQKAIAALNAHPTTITTYEEARQVRGVGDKLAAKVAEIAASGKLRKVEEVCGSEETAVINLFLGVWGAGPSTAQAWYVQGLRSLDDLQEGASLTRHQKVGLKHYHDLNERMPRDEATQIHTFVRDCCAEVRSGLLTEACGSYRRGRPTCGDVDVLITHPNGRSHAGVFTLLLDNMRRKGFLTDDLVTQEDGNQQKYLGVCRLPAPHSKHRRLDIIVVPHAELAPALMYFTGSAHFNRSMRLLATKMGMSLSEHGLRTNVVRKGSEKLTGGCLLETPTEESIFQQLGLPYRAPHERDH